MFQRLGGGGDTTVLSPGRSLKQTLPGIGLHNPLHGRQACTEFDSFHQGVGQISPQEGLFSCRPIPKRGQICDIPVPPQSMNGSEKVSSPSRPLFLLILLILLILHGQGSSNNVGRWKNLAKAGLRRSFFFWGGGGALSLHRGGGRSLSKPYQYLTPPVVSTCY